MSQRITKVFSECENQNDLNHYAQDVADSDGHVTSATLDPDTEQGTIVFEVEDVDVFYAKFEKTDSHGF